MQTSEDTLDGFGVVILHEWQGIAGSGVKGLFVEALEEETALVAEYSRFNDPDVGDIGWGGFH